MVAEASWLQRHPFIVFQASVWTLLTGLALLPSLRTEAPLRDGVAWVAVWTCSGVLWSSLFAALLERVPEEKLRGLRLLMLALPLALILALGWALTLWAFEPLVGTEPWLPPGMPKGREHEIAFARGAMLLLMWSGLFLVNLLSTRVQAARERQLKAQAMADQAQLQLLRSQLNPHFLFNALNSVVALVDEAPRRAQTMVRDVSTLLRKALDTDGTRESTVSDELDFIKLYLKCEGVRFEERLVVTWELEPSALPLRMPPMLLHPLVENAIKHGMRGQTLLLNVAVRRAGGRLVFEVSNSGSLNPPVDALLPPSSGIGLRNVTARLAQLYPGTSSFELFEREGRVVAHLELPEVA